MMNEQDINAFIDELNRNSQTGNSFVALLSYEDVMEALEDWFRKTGTLQENENVVNMDIPIPLTVLEDDESSDIPFVEVEVFLHDIVDNTTE